MIQEGLYESLPNENSSFHLLLSHCVIPQNNTPWSGWQALHLCFVLNTPLWMSPAAGSPLRTSGRPRANHRTGSSAVSTAPQRTPPPVHARGLPEGRPWGPCRRLLVRARSRPWEPPRAAAGRLAPFLPRAATSHLRSADPKPPRSAAAASGRSRAYASGRPPLPDPREPLRRTATCSPGLRLRLRLNARLPSPAPPFHRPRARSRRFGDEHTQDGRPCGARQAAGAFPTT
jgi:hypothetical protein